MKTEQKEYFIGLDMGTNSIGWAVTDNQYKLLRAKGKDMWGIREFAEALPAAERRSHRVSRRNRQRKQVRIGLLKDYFHDAIVKEDPSFFIRLENSFYHKEDKDDSLLTDDTLFADKEYSDAEYFKDYPTIFHLKYALIKDEVPVNQQYTRKLFLALLNYYKRRGHFLNASLSVNSEGTADVWTTFVSLCNSLNEEIDLMINTPEETKADFKQIFTESGVSRSRRREKIMSLLGVHKKDQRAYLILTAICGLKIDLLKLLGIESEQKAELEFSDISFDEKLPDIYAVIGTEYEWLINSLKSVYDAGILASIMIGVDWLSEARIRDYNKHKQDLALLKKCIRNYCSQEEYDFLFREETDGSYSAYIGSVNTNNKTRRGEILHKTKANERYLKLKKRIKDDLGNHSEDSEVAYILSELEAETFLPKQLTFANGVIPNQLHAREMKAILDNASKYLSFLNEKDESGLSTAERILRLYTFQIPFFVGPVSQNYKGNGWAIKNPGMENVRVLPWNIKTVINYEATNEEFILRMIRKCSYISGQNALPKESMEYQTYMVLNVINALKIRNEKISVSLKQDVYHDLFESGKRITKAKIAKYFINRGLIDSEDDVSGVDTIIGCQLNTYQRFAAVLGDDIKKDSIKQMIEQIVFWGTIYGDSKNMFRDQIVKNYSDVLTETQIKRIVGYKFRDWGKLSREFLELSGCNKETGEKVSLIRALWEDEDNLNLMELLHSEKYTFEETFTDRNSENVKTLAEFTYDDLDVMYFSAPVKRMIWQTLAIIREIEQIKGYPATKIFVEMTRAEDDKKGDAGRKDSREKTLLEVYKNIKGDRDWKKEIEEAGNSGKLQSKKMYLYYMQMGRDAYTGRPIDLSELFDDNKYDIDHIFPRHYVKDDSIHNNLVLVDKRKNSRKSDIYPIDSDIRTNKTVTDLWLTLLQKKLMSEEKYRRLTGSRPFTEEQKADFIARQMVETSQATKGVNDLLKELLAKETTLVYSKARNVSDFRNAYGFRKSRILNDFHHAQDAYLNIVVGNVYFTKFTSNPLNFVRKEDKKYNLGKMFDFNVSRNGYTAWVAPAKRNGELIEGGSSLETVRRMMNKNTPLLTRLPLTQHGALYDATIYPAKRAKADSYLPVKTTDERSNVEKYGGFNSAKNAYFFLVEHEVPGKGKDKGKMMKIRTLECLPILKRSQVEKSKDGLYQYCLEMGLKNPSVRISKIRPQSLIKVNGFPLYITGKTIDRFVVRNACNMVLDKDWHEIVHLIEKYNSTKVLSPEITDNDLLGLYDVLTKKYNSSIFARRPNPIGKTLTDGRNRYVNLSVEEKAAIILQILNLSLICNSAAADFKKIGGSTKSGVTLISKQISSFETVCIVNQSVTGLYTNEEDLLTV